MKDELKKNFESLLKNGEYAEAEKLLVPYMKDNPDDWEAKLFYGTCRMMQGDTETAKLIHQQGEKYFESGKDIPAEQKSFWDKYKKLIFYGLVGTALVLVGVASCGKAIEEHFEAKLWQEEWQGMQNKYAGPREVWQFRHAKYAGPSRPELEANGKNMW